MHPTRRTETFRHVVRLVAVGALAAAALSGPTTAASAASWPVRAGTTADSSGQANTWQATAPPLVARTGQTATLLADGQVLVAGGGTATAELYDPATRAFVSTGRMSVARTDATGTLLPSGDVLVAGGAGPAGHQLATAELYDPATGGWTPTGSMRVARSGQTATLLSTGDVLVAGGGCNPGHLCDSGSFLDTLSSAELYHPGTGTWSNAGHMASGREYATASVLPNDDVLVVGGFASCDDDFCVDTKTVDTYDPTTGAWSAARPLPAGREQQAATVMANGDVLISGGVRLSANGYSNTHLTSVERYSSSTGEWSAEPPLAKPHRGQTSALLPNGWVLVAGGGNASAQVFEPNRGIWVPTGTMTTARATETLTVLAGGDVLAVGGGVDTAETYTTGSGPLVLLAPTSLSFNGQLVGTGSPTRSVQVSNEGSATLHVSGVVVNGADPQDFTAAGDCTGAQLAPGDSCTISVGFRPTASGERTAGVGVSDDAPNSPQTVAVTGFGTGPNTWAPTGTLATGRTLDAAARLVDGSVLVAGGQQQPLQVLASAEIYDPATGTWAATGSLQVARAYVTATRLTDGRVLIAGGYGAQAPLSSAEIYTPATGTWALTSPMHAAGYALTQTLLPGGDVLVTGIGQGPGAEVYDPANDTWTDTTGTPASGFFGTATLLDTGKVLVTSGLQGAKSGLYDPATNSWSAAASPLVNRQDPRAALLPDGDVLLAGGTQPGGGTSIASSELYDPSTGAWTMTTNSMSQGRYGFTLTGLPGGDVIASGGCTGGCGTGSATTSSDRYVARSGLWQPIAPMNVARVGGTATVLRDGEILQAAGGTYCCRVYDTAELYRAALLTDRPSQGPNGTRVTLGGNGFYANERISLTWDGVTIGHARTSGDGGFRFVTTVSNASPGDHTFAAFGNESFASASAAFTVTGTG